MTFHHLVRDELNTLNPKLLRYYDQYALINLLQYWQPEAAVLLGSPTRFWKSAMSKRTHPFFGHPLLSRYGGMLAETSRRRALDRCKEKGLTRLPVAFSFQTLYVIQALRTLEQRFRSQLVQLAKGTASTVWGIPYDQLQGHLVARILPPPGLLPVRGFVGMMFRAGIVGYGHVTFRDEALVVNARATNWQLLAKELVKGTAELICLHGLTQLSDEAYRRVTAVTEWLDLEPWMLQTGGELWRRLLAALPDGLPTAKALMNLARLPAGTLESVLAPVIEGAPEAADGLASIM